MVKQTTKIKSLNVYDKKMYYQNDIYLTFYITWFRLTREVSEAGSAYVIMQNI